MLTIDDVKVGDSITWEDSTLDGRIRQLHSGTIVGINSEWDVSAQSFDFEHDVDVCVHNIITLNGKVL